MSKNWTAKDVRTEAAEVSDQYCTLASEMLLSFAERIEADEKAVDRLGQYLKSQAGYSYLNDEARRDIASGFLSVAHAHPPAQAAQFDRARETPRRQQAVETLLELGWGYNTDRGWEEPAQAAQVDADGKCFIDGLGWVVQCSRAVEYATKLVTTAEPVAQGQAAKCSDYPICSHADCQCDPNNNLDAKAYSIAAGVMGTCPAGPTDEALRRAIRAYLSAQSSAVPDGWVLVPVEATETMLDSYKFDPTVPCDRISRVKSMWHHMLAAAPTQTNRDQA